MSESLSHVDNDVNELLQTKEFGAPLKKAREKLKLSANDVADSLLITVDVIKAIDSSQVESLPALTFTQGYIRNYARLVDVPAEEIINDYIQMMPDSTQSYSPHSVIPAQKTSNDTLLKFISLSFAVMFIVVFVYWLFTTDFEVNKTQHNETVFVESSHDGKKNSIPFKVNSRDVKLVEDIQDETSDVMPVEAEPIIKKSVIKKNDETLPAKIEQKKAVVADKATDQLLLSALAKSWCEVQDATGKRLYYQLLNRGDEIKLMGTAPFILFLGNAPEVRVEINNKIVDFENLINKNSNIANLEVYKNASVSSFSNR